MLSRILLLTLILTSIIQENTAVDLKTAMNNPALEFIIKGGADTDGKSISIEARNNSSATISIEIEPGFILLPEDTTIQDMIITDQLILAIRPGTSSAVDLYAYCAEMTDRAPRDNSMFSSIKKAKGHLLTLAKYIQENSFQGTASQNAIWCLTDNSTLFSIYSDNEEMQKGLRTFIHKATGQPMNELVDVSKQRTVKETTINHTFAYPYREEGHFSMYLYDSEDNALITFFENRFKPANTRATSEYEITYRGIDEGTYYIKMVDDKGQTYYYQEIIVKAVWE